MIRTVGSIWIRSDQQAASEDPFGALGAQVVSEKAVATGVTALPDPITQEADDRWFLYKAVHGQITFADATGFANTTERYDFDSRAMRKVEDGEDVAFMIANASAGDGLVFVLKFRMLIKVN